MEGSAARGLARTEDGARVAGPAAAQPGKQGRAPGGLLRGFRLSRGDNRVSRRATVALDDSGDNGSMKTQRLAVGVALIGFPLAVQVPFNLLAVRYSYPDILNRTAGEVLTRFHEGGAGMIWTWYAYALCTLGLLFAAALLPEALGQKGGVARVSVIAGVLASVTQLLGLLRWTLVVPFLAERWVAQPEQRPMLELAFEVQHRLFGVMIGEHAGQLFMGLWTATASVLLARAAAPRFVAIAGHVSAALFIAGLGAQLARYVALPAFVTTLPLLAFVAWSLWAIAAGVVLVRGYWPSRSRKPLTNSGIANATIERPTARNTEPMMSPMAPVPSSEQRVEAVHLAPL